MTAIMMTTMRPVASLFSCMNGTTFIVVCTNILFLEYYMVYICKVYANGVPDETFVCATLAEAEVWACNHARVVPATAGWDTRYTVSIYGDVKEDADILNMFPIKIILE